jgi:hypothetical protein
MKRIKRMADKLIIPSTINVLKVFKNQKRIRLNKIPPIMLPVDSQE